MMELEGILRAIAFGQRNSKSLLGKVHTLASAFKIDLIKNVS